jgi:ribonuclease-3
MQVGRKSGTSYGYYFIFIETFRAEKSYPKGVVFSACTGLVFFLRQNKFLEEDMRRRKYFNGQDKQQLRMLIHEKTGYLIRSDCVLSQAFRRRSFCVEEEGKSNEMFEFIGDQVLSYYVVKIISERCVSMNIEGDYAFRIRENYFTSLKQELLSNEMLASIIDEWGISEYLIVGRSDEKNRVDQQTKVKADLLESIIGAIAVDSKWDPVALETAVKNALKIDDRIQSIIQSDFNSMSVNIDNAVTVLKELSEKEQCSMPKYEFAGPEALGYDADGNPKWCCSASIVNDRTGISRVVFASSKKDAKKAVSYLLLFEHLQMQNQYGPNDFYPIWIYKDGNLIPDR